VTNECTEACQIMLRNHAPLCSLLSVIIIVAAIIIIGHLLRATQWKSKYKCK